MTKLSKETQDDQPQKLDSARRPGRDPLMAPLTEFLRVASQALTTIAKELQHANRLKQREPIMVSPIWVGEVDGFVDRIFMSHDTAQQAGFDNDDLKRLDLNDQGEYVVG